MPLFEKGNTGKPKGSKDKSYLKLSFWFDEVKKDWSKLKPSQRAKLSIEMMKMLTNKLKALPVDPEESNINAEEALKMLEQIAPSNKAKEV